jgi:hypothetical protein
MSDCPGLFSDIRMGVIHQKQLIWMELHGRQNFS